MIKNQKGNVFVYILIAVGLLAALMFALSKSAGQEDGAGELSDGQNRIVAGEIIAYAASASNSLTQMQQTGATLDLVDFMLPSDVNFNTAPTLYKLFHPDGGGLNYKPLPTKAIDDDGAGLAAGYYIGRFNSVEWTPSLTNDVLFTAYEITEGVCTEINKKVANISTIPNVVGDSLANLLVDDALHAGTNANFEIVNCAACEEISALCVTDGAGKYAFYSLLEAE
jgi:hypothetical protein